LTGKRICLAKIAAPHGIKGLVKLSFYGEDEQLLQAGPLYTSETGDDTLTLTLKNPMGKYWLAEIEGVHDRNATEALKGTALYIERERLPDAPEGEYYYEDLIGLNVVDDAGEKIGTLLAVQNFGAGDLLEIKPIKGGPTLLIPFTDDYVPNVTSDTITVRAIEKLA
jgi:16S rRNA processing protein RimM